jgi:hypothetical protein
MHRLDAEPRSKGKRLEASAAAAARHFCDAS